MSNQAISCSFNSFSILTEILEIRLLTCFPLFEKTCLDFSSEIFYFEGSVGFPFEDSVDICILNVVWKCCLEVSGRDTAWERPPRCCEPLRLRRSASFSGRKRSVPRRTPLHALRSPCRESAAIHSPGTPRAYVSGGRGTIVVLMGVGWHR